MALGILFNLAKGLTMDDVSDAHMKRASVSVIFRIRSIDNNLGSNDKTHNLSFEVLDYFKNICIDFPHNLSGVLQVLFIKRAINPKDLHSGQIAFPGGKLELGESSKQAAIRETFEEIGVDLMQNFLYLGRNEEVNVYKNYRPKPLFVCCHCKF